MTENAFVLEEFPVATSPLRVAVVTETYPPEINGVAMTLGRIVGSLRRRKHSVQLIRPVSTGFHTNFHSYSEYYGIGFLKKPIEAYLRKFHNRLGLLSATVLIPFTFLIAFSRIVPGLRYQGDMLAGIVIGAAPPQYPSASEPV